MTKAIALAAVLSAGCVSVPKLSDHRTYQDGPPWYTEPTTPEMLEYLVGQLAEYQSKRANLQGRIAYAEKLMGTPEKQATQADPYAPAFSGINRATGAVAYRKLLAGLAQMDADWHRFLMDVLGKAPGVLDFDSRAVTLGLSPEQVQPYWALFQIYQQDKGPAN